MIHERRLDRRLAVCAGLSIVGHWAFAAGLRHLPRREDGRMKQVVSIRVISPPPPPPPMLEPESAPPKVAELEPPKPVPHERPRARRVAPPVNMPHPPEAPAVEHPAASDTAASPVFGISMESTSQAGNGPVMRAGGGGPRPGPAAPGPAERSAGAALGEPVPAYDVTVMPLPQGRCAGKYTDEAKQAGLEGTVVLDLVVGADGRTRDIHVVSGLAHGLTQAAIDALKTCRFTPGEREGVPVAVRVRTFKIRFVMPDNE